METNYGQPATTFRVKVENAVFPRAIAKEEEEEEEDFEVYPITPQIEKQKKSNPQYVEVKTSSFQSEQRSNLMASFNLTNREATSHLFYPLGESRKQEAALSPPTIHAASIVGYLRCNEGFLLLPLKSTQDSVSVCRIGFRCYVAVATFTLAVAVAVVVGAK
uniref:Uncharacterized protein n=1 Tax=Vespula pensylvanica TaxID=30213 RepID=A0A834PAW3_VESPE|nr:hypothetical protein H0235_002380 [Vespula pensylvanica]